MNLFFSLPVIAHILIGFYFVFYGFWNIYHWIPLLKMMTEKGLPHPYLLLSIGIVLQSIAGYLIMFGFFVKLAALILIPFTILSVFIFHPFWNFKGELRALNFSIFMANMTATLGALILLISPINTIKDFLS